MSIFGSILGKIFGHAEAATPTQTSAPSATGGSAASTTSFNNPGTAGSGSPGTTAPAAPSGTTPAGSTTGQSVDVGAILTDLASKSAQKLDWQHSIVDMMKLLGLDSSLSARQELAKELHYTGSMDDSASMNIWLHKQVMQKLAENGGKVPDSLK